MTASARIMTREEAENFFAIFYRGKHHIPGKLKEWGTGWALSVHHDLATWDFNGLTRLVVMAHDMAYRLEVIPKGASRMWIAIHKRPRGNKVDDHPELGWHIAKIRHEHFQDKHGKYGRPDFD